MLVRAMKQWRSPKDNSLQRAPVYLNPAQITDVEPWGDNHGDLILTVHLTGGGNYARYFSIGFDSERERDDWLKLVNFGQSNF